MRQTDYFEGVHRAIIQEDKNIQKEDDFYAQQCSITSFEKINEYLNKMCFKDIHLVKFPADLLNCKLIESL